MTDIEPEALSRSLVLVTDYRVPDPSRVWPLLERQRDALAHLGARHVLVYTSAVDPGRVLAVLAIRAEQPVVDILRNRAFMQWFDAVGVDDIPAVFAGSLVERIAVGDGDPSPTQQSAEPPEAVVAAVAEVADAATLIAHVHATAHDFAAAGIRKVLVFQAFDNPREVFMLQETTEEVAAARAGAWISQPAFSDDWITRAGVGVYPPVFVGHLAHLMRI
ncbi:fatty-acid--CoA ligase [Mycolicibacter sp. MYC123]|uniref:Fatty-acid--CoA ligase n=1 Tax=[Mycobacterium] zoologicum TaxID=2872311 RepID=A0ABU5YGL9_9MYCO|nr:fatty-acid--CoA ligase [Mycolicibacter sp. MYC123]MEB3049205.1 fatty-acid--CoA ligase [Mycolicibacter sp. MYC123]